MCLHLGEEAVFDCRDEGDQRARVRWLHSAGYPLPRSSNGDSGRLEIVNVQVSKFFFNIN